MGTRKPRLSLSLSVPECVCAHTERERSGASTWSSFLSLHLPHSPHRSAVSHGFCFSMQLQLVCGISLPRANSCPGSTGPHVSNVHGHVPTGTAFRSPKSREKTTAFWPGYGLLLWESDTVAPVPAAVIGKCGPWDTRITVTKTAGPLSYKKIFISKSF